MKSHPDSLLLRPVRSGMMQDEEVDPLLTEDRLYNQEDLGGEKKNAGVMMIYIIMIMKLYLLVISS